MTHDRATLYPLLLTPILKSKVWGGRRLGSLGKPLPPDEPIGESWELADLDSTSPSGGGGDAAHTIVRNGALAGSTIRRVMRAWGADLMGALDATGPFPLLVKYLDANTNLSVQVHPSAAYAAAHEDAQLKTESWYVVAADPGAVIYAGIQPGITPERFAELARNGGIESALVPIPISAGDCFNLPSGTVHALGAGALVAEVQTPSDTTFRLYDWGRQGRELHTEQAIECAEVGALRIDRKAPSPDDFSERLVVTEFYIIDERRGPARRVPLALPAAAPRVLMCIRGSAAIESGAQTFDRTGLQAGDTALLPAKLADPLLTLDDGAVVLDVTVGGA
ncbi:MAG: class I mannose-6-phosphate isomerase [Phycisphaeraceae bacterium]|nr:class I mannose-6-phosphate isomerase [Phycisphaeraceae bacterium]